MQREEYFMRRALDLAAQGSGFTQPNPLVGALIVHNDRILAEGYHHRAGEAHAEIMALNQLRTEDLGLLPESELYVSLEPCSHQGRTGPCSLAILNSGIGTIVVAHQDPNPLVAGRGLAMLRDAGRSVILGTLAKEAAEQNKRFFTSIATGRPYITLKWAQDALGQVDGPRKNHPDPWPITGPEAQVWTHRLRQECGALIVGAGTWLADATRGGVRAVAGPEIPRYLWAERPLNAVDQERADREGWTVWSPREGETSGEALGRNLRACGQVGLLVEGGPRTLQLFMDHGFCDEAYRLLSRKALPEGGTFAPKTSWNWDSRAKWGSDELQQARLPKLAL
jgi:diaminohydroxyphosphoribosylaminopyrimidine deaminase/5-amino-6-(5-phosphoribosylamino)uracil reductase